jgi:hypothetical protein
MSITLRKMSIHEEIHECQLNNRQRDAAVDILLTMEEYEGCETFSDEELIDCILKEYLETIKELT